MGTARDLMIGERLRLVRKAQGKTQAVVGGLAGVSEDYVGQIERGEKTPTIAVLHQFAAALGVRTSELLGETSADGGPTLVHSVASEIQSAMMTYGPGSHHDAEVPSLTELRRRVDDVWAVWQLERYRFTEASKTLPQLTVDVQRKAREVRLDAQKSRTAAEILADLNFLLRTFTKRIGRPDLSLLAADRSVTAAEDADDPMRVAAAKWNLGQILLAQQEPEGAEEVAMSALAALPELSESPPDAAALRGALALVAAIAAMRRHDSWMARDRLREQAVPAARVAGEGNVHWTVFGPLNVDLHAMSIEMECGEAGEALRLADRIDISVCASLERQTTFYLDLARACAQRRDDSGVLVHLMNAEVSGPEDMRFSQSAHELVRGLVKRCRPTLRPQAVGLATRIGVQV